MYRRHDRHAEVDIASLVTNPETSVLRNTSLGDVEFGHDLNTRDQRLVVSEIDRIDLGVESAVDSVLNLHLRVLSLDMNIRSARLHRVVDDRIDQLDDWRHFGIS